MGKKKQKKEQSEPEQQIDESDESVKPKQKAKGKKEASKKTPAKSTPKKQEKPASKAASKGKGKAKNGSKSKGDDDEEVQKIDKKKDFLPGQKHQTPDQDDGARAFYSSLYAQNPDSELAKKYCLEYGLLQKDEALKVQKELAKKK